MKLLYAIIPLISIAAALPDASPNPFGSASKKAVRDLKERSACTSDGGVCVNTNDANACSYGVGVLVTGLCPGGNSEICCFTDLYAC